LNALSVTEKNFHNRSRVRQSQFRKQQLIEATIDCIDKLGLSQTTLAHISKRAGVSQGNLIFHFRSKDLLLQQALRHLSEEYLNNWKSALNKAKNNPIERLCALVTASFEPAICTRKKISVWYAFWGEARSRPVYMSLCGDHDQAFSGALRNLCHDLGKVTNATLSADSASITIEAMIDGLWQNFLIGPAGFNRQQAIQEILQLVSIIYPDESKSIQQLANNSRGITR